MPQSVGNLPHCSLVLVMQQDTRSGNSGIWIYASPKKLLLTFMKILQRVYKYGGQPFARDFLAIHYGNEFDNAFGKGTGKAILHATAGR